MRLVRESWKFVTFLALGLAAVPLAGESLTTVSDPFPLSPEDAQFRFTPALAMAPDGSFLAAWSEDDIEPSNDMNEIRGQLFDRDGNPVGIEFQITRNTNFIAGGPRAVRLPNGQFIVIWTIRDSPTETRIFGCPLEADGTPAGPHFQLSASDGDAFQPVLAASPTTGEFVVAWTDRGADVDDPDVVKFRRFAADTTPLGPEVSVADHSSMASVQVAPSGDFVIGWEQFQFPPPAIGNGLVARWFDHAGEPLAEPVLLGPPVSFRYDMLLQNGGSLLVAWTGADETVQARRFIGVDLQAASPAVPLSEGSNNTDVLLTTVGESVFATWVETEFTAGPSAGLHGRLLASDLQVLTEPLALQDSPAYSQFAIAGNSAGRLAVSYLQDHESTAVTATKVFGRLFQTETTCTPGMTRLCLNGGRFAVEALWRTTQGTAGAATAVPLTADTGYFTFFNPNNVEMVVKVINGCVPPFNRYWVFAAGLTNVEVDLVVTDTETGEVATYRNPQATPFQPILDTDAFMTCP